MSLEKFTRLALRAAFAAWILALSWFVPPMVHKALHLCPVRPDGVPESHAVPAFARKYGYSCQQCHTNFPTLNEFGRQFKLNGYVSERNSEEGVLKSKDGSFWTEKLFPWGVVIRSRPYDKTTGNGPQVGNKQTEFSFQPVQDMDLFVAGGDASKHVSYFGELDANNANGNAGNGFAISVNDLQLGYHVNDYFNIVGARRGFYVMDPYQTLSNFGSPTIGNRATAGLNTDQQLLLSGNTGNVTTLQSTTLDQTTQTGMVYGEVGGEKAGYLYYAGGMTAGRGVDNGGGNKAVNARLAFDTLKGLVLGTFYTFGHEASNVTNVTDRFETRRGGFDLLFEKGPIVSRAAMLFAQNRNLASNDRRWNNNYSFGGLKTSDRAAYADLSYIYKLKDEKIPFLIPQVRYNWYTTYNGKRSFDYLTAQLTHYFRSNFKGFIEWDGDTKQDITGTPAVPANPRLAKASRWIAQFELGF